MIDRVHALKLLDKYVSTPWLRLHMIESEAIMISLARCFGEEEYEWGLAGLLHDLDFDYVCKDALRHGVEIDNIFKTEGIEIGRDIPQSVYHAIKAHCESNPNISQKRESKLDYALSSAETISGFLVACALVQPDKRIKSVNVDSVMKKFKKKDFAKGVNRQLIYDIEKVGMSLDEFVQISLDALCSISEDIGL